MNKQPKFGDLVQRHTQIPRRLGMFLRTTEERTWIVLLLRFEASDDARDREEWGPGQTFLARPENWEVVDDPKNIAD